MKTIKEKLEEKPNLFVGLVVAVCLILFAVIWPAQAVPVGASYAPQQLPIPWVINTNSTLQFTNTVPITYIATNADATSYTNTVGPVFIDASAERFVALDIKVLAGVVNGTAGASNEVIVLSPAVLNTTNAIVIPTATGGASKSFLGCYVDTNASHVITLTVPLAGLAGEVQDWVTNLDGAGLAGWWIVSIQNQVKNDVITNVITYSSKSGAP